MIICLARNARPSACSLSVIVIVAAVTRTAVVAIARTVVIAVTRGTPVGVVSTPAIVVVVLTIVLIVLSLRLERVRDLLKREIGEAIRTVLDCGSWLPPAWAQTIESLPSDPADTDLAARLARLTEQQYRVLVLLGEGLLNKQIADRLSIQERTVKAHVTAIFEKLGVRNRTQAVVLLQSLALSDPARL